jgi:hypothetical protein
MSPFSAPKTLSPDLTRVRAYWEGMLRGAATMPFWDDFAPGGLGDLQGAAFTLEAFDKPERFRVAYVGADLKPALGGDFEGVFLGEGPAPAPFAFLLSQASATVESGQPTLYRGDRFQRLLLPMWGEGRIGLLLGCLDRS